MDARFNLSGVWKAVGVEAGENITESFLLHEGISGKIVGGSLAVDKDRAFDMDGSTQDGVVLTLRQYFRANQHADSAAVCRWDATIVQGVDGRLELHQGRWSGDGISGAFTAVRSLETTPDAHKNGVEYHRHVGGGILVLLLCASFCHAVSGEKAKPFMPEDCHATGVPLLNHRYEAGNIVQLHQVVVLEDGVRRGRTDKGWISFQSRSGRQLFEPVVADEVRAEVVIVAAATGVSRCIGLAAQFGATAAKSAANAVIARPLFADKPLQNEPASIKGNIVVVTRGAVTFGEKARRVEEAGGAAMLIVTDDHEPYVPLGTPADDSILIPVVSIGKRAGAALLANAGCEQGERPCPAVISIRYQSKMLEKPRKIGKCATLATETSADLHLIRRFKRLVQCDMRRHINKQRAFKNASLTAEGICSPHERVFFNSTGQRMTKLAGPEWTCPEALNSWLATSRWTCDTAGTLDPLIGGPVVRPSGDVNDGEDCTAAPGGRWWTLWTGAPEAGLALVQRNWRRISGQARARRLRLLLVQMQRLQHQHREAAVTRIQASHRGKLGRRIVATIRSEKLEAEQLTAGEKELLAEKTALMCCLNAEIERDRLTADEADVLAQKTALMLCLNAGIEGEHPIASRRTPATNSPFATEPDSSILSLIGGKQGWWSVASDSQTRDVPSTRWFSTDFSRLNFFGLDLDWNSAAAALSSEPCTPSREGSGDTGGTRRSDTNLGSFRWFFYGD